MIPTAQEFSDALLDTQTVAGTRWRVVAVSGVVLLAIGATVWHYVAPTAVAKRSAIRSITVIPVKSLEADSSSVVLAEALSLALNTQIGQLGGIEAATRYRDQQADAASRGSWGGWGAPYDVLAVPRQRAGARPAFDAIGTMWAHQYDYGLQNLLRLSSDVARHRPGDQVRLTSEERRSRRACRQPRGVRAARGDIPLTQRGRA
jgi:TolB-like protein